MIYSPRLFRGSLVCSGQLLLNLCVRVVLGSSGSCKSCVSYRAENDQCSKSLLSFVLKKTIARFRSTSTCIFQFVSIRLSRLDELRMVQCVLEVWYTVLSSRIRVSPGVLSLFFHTLWTAKADARALRTYGTINSYISRLLGFTEVVNVEREKRSCGTQLADWSNRKAWTVDRPLFSALRMNEAGAARGA